VLLRLPGLGRETGFHKVLGRPRVTVATATARLADHPAGRVWLVAGGADTRQTWPPSATHLPDRYGARPQGIVLVWRRLPQEVV